MTGLILERMGGHRGIGNALPRRELLAWLRLFDPEFGDRSMREIIKDRIPQICFCQNGYYLATSREEVEASIAQLKKRIVALAEDVRKVREAYPEFYGDGQLELFI